MAKKNTDETILDVQEVYSKSEQFFENNKKAITGILVAVIAVVAAFWAYHNFVKAPAIASANEEIAKAEAYWLMDSIDAAVQGKDEWDGFEVIADKYASNGVGKRANFYMGVYKRDKNDFEGALEHFKMADFSSPILGAFTSGNIGDCLVEMGAALDAVYDSEDGSSDPDAIAKYEEALPYFVKAANSSVDEMTTLVYFKKAANVCLKLGLYNKAEKMYDGIIASSSNANSNDYKEALRMKAMCSAKQLAQ